MFKDFINRRGLTLREFTSQSGFNRRQVKDWISGKASPSRAELRDVAMAFGVSVHELIAPTETQPYSGRLGPPPSLKLLWGDDHRRRWTPMPYSLWGYLRLQLTGGGKILWYPVSGEHAALLQDELDLPGQSTIIVAQTLCNRVLLFARSRIISATLVEASVARRSADFVPRWDHDGLPPELYRALRDWAWQEYLKIMFDNSPPMREIVGDAIERFGMRRRQMIAAVDDTVVRHIDGRSLHFRADDNTLREALWGISLGALTLELIADESDLELSLPLEQIRLIDMPATDLQLISNVVITRSNLPD